MESEITNPVLADYPNPLSNVFLMIRFRDTGQHQAIGQAIAETLSGYSLNLLRADQKQYTDELWSNVRLYMDAAGYGIAVFEQIYESDINPNVSLELGYMLAQGKRCLLLKEKNSNPLQADLCGHLYSDFDSEQIQQTVSKQVERWLRDLGIAKRAGERLLIYVSAGGTCRDPMAKAITHKLLEQNPPENLKLRIAAMACIRPSAPGASKGAREAIKELYGEDLLRDHRAATLTSVMAQEADLILVMDHSLKSVVQRIAPLEKIHVLKPFFGLEGDIVDPWPDNGEPAAVRYNRCRDELRMILESNLEKLIEALR